MRTSSSVSQPSPPRHMMKSIVPKQQSSSSVMNSPLNTQFSFGPLKVIRQASEERTSRFNSITTSKTATFPMTESISSFPDRQSAMKSKLPGRVINMSVPRNFNPPQLKLKEIQEQTEEEKQQPGEIGFWQNCWNKMSCCRKSDQYRGISEAW